jgi:hypothetical protein
LTAPAGLRELGSGGGGGRRLKGLVEVATVDQHGVEDHRELAGEGDQRLLAADPCGERLGPGLQCWRPGAPKGQALRGFEQQRALELVTGARDLAGMVGFARLVAPRRGLLTASPLEIG